MKKITFQSIINSYTSNPRNVITKENGVWFYAYSDGENVYIESGRGEANCSKITVRRRLDTQNFQKIYYMYTQGKPRSEIRDVTQNSSYWLGIFEDMKP